MRWLRVGLAFFGAWNLAVVVLGDTADPELRFWTALAMLALSYLAHRLYRRTA